MAEEIKIGKRGVLSLVERKFIEENISFKTIQEISKEIGKSEKTVRKYVFAKNLVSKEETEKVPNAHRKARVKDILRSREYWPEIKRQFDSLELSMFEEHFVNLYLQFDEDVLASEELQIKKYVTLEILKDRMLKLDFSNSQQIEQIKKMLDEEYSLPSDQKNPETVKMLNNNIERLQANQLTFLKEYREMTEEQKYAEKALKISRDDRIKNIQDATQNWTSVVRTLSENQIMRDKVGRHIEIMNIAAEQQKNKLFGFHKYINGAVDKPILSKESIEYGDIEDENSSN